MDELRHNVVNILYSLKGAIETHMSLLQAGKLTRRDEAFRHAEEVLRKAYGQADQALKITRRLGLIAEPDSQDGVYNGRADVKRIWHEMLRVLRKEFSFMEIEVIERIPEDFPPVLCAGAALQEIFYNLAKNAVQAMGKKGKLVIRAQIAFSTREERYALISISDTGPGIPEDKMPCLFTPFFTTKSEGEGSGLGLCFTKGLVAKHHGRIIVSSFEGFGASFAVEFPFVPRAENGEKMGSVVDC